MLPILNTIFEMQMLFCLWGTTLRDGHYPHQVGLMFFTMWIFVVDGDGRVGIGTASPVSGFALTLNGDGTNYEGLAFQSGGSTKFKQSTDGSAMYFDSAINTGNVNFRVKDSGGNLRPALGIEGSNFSVAVGYNGTSGSALNPKNTFQVNVGTENGVQDNDDGVSDLSSYSSIKIVLDNSSVDFKSRINSSDSDYRMPPSGLMSQNNINKLNDWIDSGYPE